MLSVRYRAMWPGFSPGQGGLPQLIRSAAGGQVRVVESPRERVDLEVCSVFPRRVEATLRLGLALSRRAIRRHFDYRASLGPLEPSESARRGIWYTGENQRPPALTAGWDLTLSFEPSDWPRNVYLPLWLLGTDAFGMGAPGFAGTPVGLQSLTAGRLSGGFLRRPRFACTFIRNPEPTRLTVIDALRELGEVDVFGPVTGRPVPSKLDVAGDYRFMLCMENDLYPGYVTEKPIEAWTAGCVPLWWGLDRERNLNSRAMVNLADCLGLDDFVNRVRGVDTGEGELESMWRQPLVVEVPDAKAIVARVREIL